MRPSAIGDTIECHRCGVRLPASAPVCCNCGTQAPHQRRSWTRAGLIGAAAALAVVAFGGYRLVPGGTGNRTLRAEPLAAAEAPDPTEPPIVTVPATPAPTAAPRTQVRWASTWINVRERRSVESPVVTTLNPGDEVHVFDRQGNWWAVQARGRTIGYVANSVLDTTPPTPGTAPKAAVASRNAIP